MKLLISTLLLLLSSSLSPTLASGASSTSPAYKAAAKAAAERYADDRKLCADESESKARMQCLRDAKAEYTKSLADAKKLSTSENHAQTSTSICVDCGKVVSVTVGERKGKATALGVVGGGVAGALLGNQLGSGTGRTLATIAGAAGGAFAGDKVEEKLKATKFWAVKVQLDDGTERTVDFDRDPGFANGDLVRVSGSSVTRR